MTLFDVPGLLDNRSPMEQYVCVLAEGKSSQRVAACLVECLRNAGFRAETFEAAFLILDLPADRLLEEASKAGLKKESVSGDMVDFDLRNKKMFKRSTEEGFLFPFEKQYILRAVLEKIQVGSKMLSVLQQEGVDVSNIESAAPLVLTCSRLEMFEVLIPLHSPSELQSIWSSAKFQLFLPLKQIRTYFGEHVAFYCAWLNFYTTCLLLPALAGASLFVYNSYTGYTVEDSPYVPYFSFFMVLWSTVFLKLWRRRASQLACDWDTFNEEKREDVRTAFRGIVRKSPVTDKDELYYPTHLRFLKYCFSVFVSALLLGVALLIMAMSLNLQGYVQSESAIFYVATLSQYAQPGALFDAKSQVMCFVPVVLHVITIQLLNTFYKGVAARLTDWENHRTEQAHEASLILKRFCFEAFDSYLPIFFLAFVEQDIMRVRVELTSLYMVDCLRRVGTELLLPLGHQFFKKAEIRKKLEGLKRSSREKPGNEQAIKDAELDPYEEFDDYLEMVIAFGYITMFASAFPFAAFVQIIYNLIEMKSDAYKICFVVQRPPVVRAKQIGSWQIVLQTQAWISLITNILMFALSSGHLKSWCAFAALPEVGCFCLGVLSLEHLIGLAMFLILQVGSDMPETVQTKLKRQKYLKKKMWAGDVKTE